MTQRSSDRRTLAEPTALKCHATLGNQAQRTVERTLHTQRLYAVGADHHLANPLFTTLTAHHDERFGNKAAQLQWRENLRGDDRDWPYADPRAISERSTARRNRRAGRTTGSSHRNQ